jgi:hypothetical protein
VTTHTLEHHQPQHRANGHANGTDPESNGRGSAQDNTLGESTAARVCCGQHVSSRFCTWCGGSAGPKEGETTSTGVNPSPADATADTHQTDTTPQRDHDGATHGSVKEATLTVLAALWAFVMETEEQRRPEVYGKRLPGRRAWLLIAVVMLGV